MRKYHIFGPGSPCLKAVNSSLAFPLKAEDKEDIKFLQFCFRESFMDKGLKTLGLAAPQVGINSRFFIMPRKMDYRDVPIPQLKFHVRAFNVFINPELLSQSTQSVKIEETCLSVGPLSYMVERSAHIEVQYYDLDGDCIRKKMNGLLARVFLHELDHLNGILLNELGAPLYNGNSI